MTSEWRTDVQEGYRTKVMKVGNCTIEIHRPILTEEERIKAENQVRDALRGFGRSKKNES